MSRRYAWLTLMTLIYRGRACRIWGPRVPDINHVGSLALGAMRAPPAARHCEVGVLAAWAPRALDINHASAHVGGHPLARTRSI